MSMWLVKGCLNSVLGKRLSCPPCDMSGDALLEHTVQKRAQR